ncbi:squalene epoxidase-domain-containing protein [Hyaloraphidium curvatum]|nr:squalene epoxidase-domain-containing protein [Hyaloraphidium curvatum]
MPFSGNEALPPLPEAFPGPAAQYECIVVGAGIVGAPLAATLARQGRRVLLIERDMREPDRIVGELMQPGGVAALRALGLGRCLDGIDAAPCSGYAVILGGRDVVLDYPPPGEAGPAVPHLPDPVRGVGFHHGRFIMRLREAALGEKKWAGGFRAPLTFVADGCFSKFRKDYVDRTIEVPGHFVGLVLDHADLPHPGYGHVVLANPSPILLYQISSTETRILVDVPGAKLPSAANGDLTRYMRDKVAPQLPERVRPSFLRAVESDNRLRSMPNQYLPPTANTTPGMILLGDANNMRHPLTGGGMTVGLADVVMVTDLLKGVDFNDSKLVLDKCAQMHWQRKNLAGVVNVLSLALYRLFSAGSDENMAALQHACFAYFELGGRAVTDPVSLLGCILPSPATLFYHFFAVAFYAMYHICSSGRLVDLPRNVVRSAAVLFSAARVIFPLIAGELEARPMVKREAARRRDPRVDALLRVGKVGMGVLLAGAVARYVLRRR